MSSRLANGTAVDSVTWAPPSIGGAGHVAVTNWVGGSESVARASGSGADSGALSEAVANVARIQQLESEVATLRARIPDEKRISHQEGFDQGSRTESAKWVEELNRAARALADLAAYKPKLRRDVESDAVRLALAIARKVIRREMSVDPGVMTGLVRVAFDKVNARDVLRIRTSQVDAPELIRRIAEMGFPEQITIVGDPSLARGAMVLDTQQGQVDTSVDAQLDEIERGLTDALDRSLC